MDNFYGDGYPLERISPGSLFDHWTVKDLTSGNILPFDCEESARSYYLATDRSLSVRPPGFYKK